MFQICPRDTFHHLPIMQMKEPLIVVNPEITGAVLDNGESLSVRHTLHGSKPVVFEVGDPFQASHPYAPVAVLSNGFRTAAWQAIVRYSPHRPSVFPLRFSRATRALCTSPRVDHKLFVLPVNQASMRTKPKTPILGS